MDFEKKVKKRRSNNIYMPIVLEDHSDHPQSVLLSFAQLAWPLYFNQK